MSTILDALKRVEEQLRQEAGRAAADGATSNRDISSIRVEPPVQAGGLPSAEGDEVTEVYLSLVDLIGRIQDRVQATLEHERNESQKRVAETERTLAGLRADLASQQHMLQDTCREHEKERAADRDATASALSPMESLKQTQAEVRASIEHLAADLAALRNDVARQREAVQKENQQRDAERESKEAALAITESQMHTKIRREIEDLAKTLATTRNELASQKGSLEHEIRQRDSEREAGRASLATAQSQVQSELRTSSAGLTETMAALHRTLATHTDRFQKEIKQRERERQTVHAAMEGIQSQVEYLRHALGETREGVTKLIQAVSTLQKEFVHQRDANQRECERRDREHEAGKTALARTQSETESVQSALAGTRERVAELSQETGALQQSIMGQEEGFRQEIVQRDAEQKAGKAALSKLQSLIEPLRQEQTEANKTVMELSLSMASLRDDVFRQLSALPQEVQRLSTEQEAERIALAAVQSQMDALQRLLAEPCAAVPHGPHDASLAMAPDMGAHAQDGWPGIVHEESLAAPQAPGAVDSREAQRLHTTAGEAYTAGDYVEALRLLDIINAAFPDNRSILYNRTECLIALGRHDEARALCDYLIGVLEHEPARLLRSAIKE